MSEERGVHVLSNWGQGDIPSKYATGDIVWIPETSPCITEGRVKRHGLHRVHSVFSIDEEPWFYYRVWPIDVTYANGYRLRQQGPYCSGRVHVLPDFDLTADWTLIYQWPSPLPAQDTT